MPTSRKRRPRRTPPPRARGRPRDRSGAGSAARLADLAGAPYLAQLMRVNEAEARGDAWAAVELAAELPFEPDGRLFWRPSRIRRLTQLATWGPVLPRWATSRWMLEQAAQHMDDARRWHVERALQIAIEVRGGEDRLPGSDALDARTKVIDHDWVFRQVLLHELGGLDHFLRRAASPDLVCGADGIEQWAGARMGAYTLVSHAPSVVVWQELATGEEVRVGNIGSAVLLEPGEHAIGRLVPVEGGRMFESVPLRVTAEVAAEVARDPGAWIDALTAAGGDGRRSIIRTGGHQFELLNDVPTAVWLLVVCGRRRPVPEGDRARAGQVLAFARQLLAEPLRAADPREFDVWACLSAALLDVDVGSLLEAAAPNDASLFGRLADLLAEPAATVCAVLAGELSGSVA